MYKRVLLFRDGAWISAWIPVEMAFSTVPVEISGAWWTVDTVYDFPPATAEEIRAFESRFGAPS